MTREEIEQRKREMRDVLVLRAAMIEDSIRFDNEFDFFCGLDTQREIHISSSKFSRVVEWMQAVVTYNPNWKCVSSTAVEAYFYTELFGKKYKVFALLDSKEEKK